MRINFYFILNNRLKYHFKVFFKMIVYYTKIITTKWCPWLAPKYGYQNQRLHICERCSLPTDLDLATCNCGTVKRTKGGSLLAFLVKLVPNNMAVSFKVIV